MPTALITGGTGMIGKALTETLLQNNYEVIILTRKLPEKQQDEPRVRFALWNIHEQTVDKNAIADADYVIHLAGASLSEKSWTTKRKKEILESRVKSSELLVKSLHEITNHVKAVVSASGVGWYGASVDFFENDGMEQKAFTEEDPPANDFIGQVCREWEAGIEPVSKPGIRLVKLRIGVVLSNKGGFISEMMRLVRFGIAPVLGHGRQKMAWIHIDDLVRMILFAMENESVAGVFNAAAPQPVSNTYFIRQLAKVMKGRWYLPVYVPAIILKLMRGEMSNEVLKSIVVSSGKIQRTGFSFLYPETGAALHQIAGGRNT
jgi:uncharacterized protein (TIGR01777 family)